ncbi:Gfo/Idh/MocA family oxidoreductase [Olivibacter sp. SDN3]|uniref:Gfo/Idh/MocA family protein n=1 Tax=Olivibacter sp. SDN3 TaxID=2764720 RepID=UPI0016511BC8|nr:Gfo/Idh/MocA family oxidoreductase [Olivibacter sp. SDN3]QNL49506.1 Gfo/Idh/MocA family oxidoreductase [Olivibacter sp. SDN3]
MDRRSFLQKGGMLGAGMFMLDGLAAKADNWRKEEPVNIGMIGCGDRGKGVLSVIESMPDLYRIRSFCDVLDFRLDETKQRLGVNARAFTDYRKLLDDRNLDAVFIAVPLSAHFEVAKAAIEAGKHVYIEKTMTFSIEEAQELTTLVNKYPKLTVQVGYQYRYSPLYFKVKEMIDNDYLGKVTQIDCRWDRNGTWRRSVPRPDLERQINWRMYKEYSGGLPAELLSHQIDFINWAFDTHPDEIMGTGGIDIYNDGRETFDNVQVMFRYSKAGMIGNFGATCGNARDGYLFKIKGTRGTVSLLTNTGIYYPENETKEELQTVDGVTGATKIVWNDDGGTSILNEPTKDGTWYALEEFYKSVITNSIPSSNVQRGARATVCVALANQSIYNNTIEHWKEAYDF